MATVIKNLGQVAGLVKKATAPTNTNVLWKNTVDGLIYYYDDDSSSWTVLGNVSGGAPVYSGVSPANVNLGGISSGYVLTGKLHSKILEDLLVQYQAPSFTAFSMSGQATTLEVGQAVSGTKTFTWSTANAAQIDTGIGLSIFDYDGGDVELANALVNDGSQGGINVGSTTYSEPASHIWQIRGTNTKGASFTRNFTVNWRMRVFTGTSANTTLNEAQIEALTGALVTSPAGTYAMSAGNYKYICYPDYFSAPLAGTGFKDAATNLAVDMATDADNAFFQYEENGWYYGLVSVTNAYGLSLSYRVYRTKATLGGSISIVVSI
jgi:hypothetical protein